MKCPECKKDNPGGSRFCQFCGTSLNTTAADTAFPSPAAQSQLSQSQDYTQRGLRPVESARATAPIARQQIGQAGSGGMSALNLWGPFAGYGTRRRHVSWLLDNLGGKADALHQAINGRFAQREIPGSDMKWQTLTARGLLVERRPFYFVRRGISTAALYIAQFGQDLYISQTTYIKGPISNVRVVILAIMLIFQLYYSYGFTSSLLNSISGYNPLFGSTSGGLGPFLFFLCIIGPLGAINSLLLVLALVYSIYKFITEKDFVALLRTPPNEFQEDDTIALEKAVEETVRQALDSIGIDPVLMPPAVETSLWRRLI